MRLTIYDKCGLALLVASLALACFPRAPCDAAPTLGGFNCKIECANQICFGNKMAMTSACFKYDPFNCERRSNFYCLDGSNCLGLVNCVNDGLAKFDLIQFDDNSCQLCAPIAVGAWSSATCGKNPRTVFDDLPRQKCDTSS